MNPADVLEAAADALWIYGRLTGHASNDSGAMCVGGAICHVEGVDMSAAMGVHRTSDAGRALARYLLTHDELHDRADRRFIEDQGYLPAWVWNDHQRGPEGDELVIDTLRRCAKALRNGELEP